MLLCCINFSSLKGKVRMYFVVIRTLLSFITSVLISLYLQESANCCLVSVLNLALSHILKFFLLIYANDKIALMMKCITVLLQDNTANVH